MPSGFCEVTRCDPRTLVSASRILSRVMPRSDRAVGRRGRGRPRTRWPGSWQVFGADVLRPSRRSASASARSVTALNRGGSCRSCEPPSRLGRSSPRLRARPGTIWAGSADIFARDFGDDPLGLLDGGAARAGVRAPVARGLICSASRCAARDRFLRTFSVDSFVDIHDQMPSPPRSHEGHRRRSTTVS